MSYFLIPSIYKNYVKLTICRSISLSCFLSYKEYSLEKITQKKICILYYQINDSFFPHFI